jgi:hypothetical protein
MSISNGPNRFGFLKFGHCELFVICDLEFFSETKKFLSRSNLVLAASGRAEPRFKKCSPDSVGEHF